MIILFVSGTLDEQNHGLSSRITKQGLRLWIGVLGRRMSLRLEVGPKIRRLRYGRLIQGNLCSH